MKGSSRTESSSEWERKVGGKCREKGREKGRRGRAEEGRKEKKRGSGEKSVRERKRTWKSKDVSTPGTVLHSSKVCNTDLQVLKERSWLINKEVGIYEQKNKRRSRLIPYILPIFFVLLLSLLTTFLSSRCQIFSNTPVVETVSHYSQW